MEDNYSSHVLKLRLLVHLNSDYQPKELMKNTGGKKTLTCSIQLNVSYPFLSDEHPLNVQSPLWVAYSPLLMYHRQF